MIQPETLNSLQKLRLVRILRPDKFIAAVQHMILENMDSGFIEFPPFDLQSAYDDSTCFKPLIFVLSPGAPSAHTLMGRPRLAMLWSTTADLTACASWRHETHRDNGFA